MQLDTRYREACEGFQRVYGLVVPLRARNENHFVLIWPDFGLASDLRAADVPMDDIVALTGIPKYSLSGRWTTWFPELNDGPRPVFHPPNPRLREIEAALSQGIADAEIRKTFSLSIRQLSGIKFRWKNKSLSSPASIPLSPSPFRPR